MNLMSLLGLGGERAAMPGAAAAAAPAAEGSGFPQLLAGALNEGSAAAPPAPLALADPLAVAPLPVDPGLELDEAAMAALDAAAASEAAPVKPVVEGEDPDADDRRTLTPVGGMPLPLFTTTPLPPPLAHAPLAQTPLGGSPASLTPPAASASLGAELALADAVKLAAAAAPLAPSANSAAAGASAESAAPAATGNLARLGRLTAAAPPPPAAATTRPVGGEQPAPAMPSEPATTTPAASAIPVASAAATATPAAVGATAASVKAAQGPGSDDAGTPASSALRPGPREHSPEPSVAAPGATAGGEAESAAASTTTSSLTERSASEAGAEAAPATEPAAAESERGGAEVRDQGPEATSRRAESPAPGASGLEALRDGEAPSAQAAKAKAPAPTLLRSDELPERALRILSELRADGAKHYRAELQLDPPGLGRVRIDFELSQRGEGRGEQAVARITVESAAAHEQLQAELPRLRTLLAEQGLGEAQVELHLRQGHGQGAQEQQAQRSPWQGTERGEREGSGPALAWRSSHDGLIDLRA